MKPQLFYTYGDTDEPAVPEQMNGAHARMDQLSARCATLERFVAQLLSYHRKHNRYATGSDIQDFIARYGKE